MINAHRHYHNTPVTCMIISRYLSAMLRLFEKRARTRKKLSPGSSGRRRVPLMLLRADHASLQCSGRETQCTRTECGGSASAKLFDDPRSSALLHREHEIRRRSRETGCLSSVHGVYPSYGCPVITRNNGIMSAYTYLW